METQVATVPNAIDPAPTDPAPPDFGSVVPAEYKDKPYMKDVTSFEALFKQHDNVQSMIGKRPSGIPQDTDAQEKWNEFYKSAGRPEKAEEYEFENAPEGMKRNDDIFTQTKALFHQAGLSKKQAKELQIGYEKLIHGANTTAQQAFDTEFDTLAKEHFGDRQDKVLEDSAKLLKELAPQAFSEHISSLDNKNLIILSAVLDAVRQKYINEDSVPSTRDAEQTTRVNMRSEGKKLMASDAFQNSFHPEHEATKARVTEIYKSITS